MDMLGSIARIDPGSAVTRRSSGSVVPASNPPAGNSGDDSNQRGSTTVAQQAGDTPTPPKAPAPPRQAAPPPAVVLGGFYEKRISNGPNGLTIDLVYKNTGLRAARLVGRSSSTAGESEVEGEQAVAAGTAARAYRSARGGTLASTTQLTG
jgi:hypothetical protein